MHTARSVGRVSSVQKYDVITALTVYALSCGGSQERRVLRFLTLVTSRYNWVSGELSIGQAEIARLWSTGERTVKRALQTFKKTGWLIVKRPAARGRVTVYKIGFDAIKRDTSQTWHVVGPDFMARVSETEPTIDSNIVLFDPVHRSLEPNGQGRWARVQAVLAARDPSRYKAWFAALDERDGTGATAVLTARSEFIASYLRSHLLTLLLATYREVDPSVQSVEIQS